MLSFKLHGKEEGVAANSSTVAGRVGGARGALRLILKSRHPEMRRPRSSVTTDLTVLLRAISQLPVTSGDKWSSDGAAGAENEFPDAALILSPPRRIYLDKTSSFLPLKAARLFGRSIKEKQQSHVDCQLCFGQTSRSSNIFYFHHSRDRIFLITAQKFT